MDPGPFIRHGHRFHEGLGWGGWLLWVLFMIALWALVIMAIVWLVRSFTHRGPVTQQRGMGAYGAPATWQPGGAAGTGGLASAEQILAERFAQGQIDENEYRARLGVLRGERPAAPQADPPPAPPTPPE